MDRFMAIHRKRRAPAAILPLILAVALVFPYPVFGITLGEEEELAREILRIIFKRYEVIEDPAIAGYVSRVGNRIQAALPEQPFRFRFYVLNDPSYNAFATPGGHIFVFSGLLAAMEEEDELAGILGHEIAHVTCRHISQKIELAKKVGWATLAGMAAGVLIGAAGGAAAAASGVIMGSAAAGATTQLAFSRENEMQSDQLGLKYLGDAGYGAGGLLKVLKKIRSKVWYGKEQIPSYMMTHPAIEDRIVYVGSWIESAPAAKRPAADPAEFERMQTRLIADYSDTHAELNRLGEELRRKPADVLSRYRYALVLAKADRREESIAQFKEALARRAFDPYMLRDLGRVYFADGKLAQAQSALESARATIPNDPDCLFYLGRTRQELGHRAEALALYSAIVQKTPAYREAYYFLGKGLGEQGNLTDAHYYLGIYHAKGRDYKTAAIQFRQALKQNPEPDMRERIERFLFEVEGELKSERERRTTD
jgi:predicted Zn-dependent protease